ILAGMRGGEEFAGDRIVRMLGEGDGGFGGGSLISVQGKGKIAFPADSTVDIDGLELEFQALVVNTADICPDVGIAGCPGKLPSHQHIRGVGSVSINRSGYSILQDPEVYAHIVRSSCLPGQVDIAQRARV